MLLWTTAALCFGVTSWGAVQAIQANKAAEQLAVDAGKTNASAPNIKAESPADSTSARNQAGDVVGRVRISALGLSVPMTVGVETSSLLRGVGHVEGTAWPGGLGTVGLAGHRDTYLRPLERVAPGMDIEVLNASGTYHYSVDNFEVVTPEQVDVLSIRSRPELVLITCYPFHYVGAAPKRFVVHAHLVSLTPDAPSSGESGTSPTGP